MARSAVVSRRSVAAVALGVLAASCGTAELEVAQTFDGSWNVTELVSEGEAIDLVGQRIEIEIDTGQAAVRGQTNCQQLFGSYSLVESNASNGDASFTIPSPAASTECRSVDQLVHTELVDALESVTRWQREGSTLTLSSPSGSTLALQALNRDE